MHKWYFVRCQSGSEDSIRKQVELRLKMAGVSDLVPQVLVPFERVTTARVRMVFTEAPADFAVCQVRVYDQE